MKVDPQVSEANTSEQNSHAYNEHEEKKLVEYEEAFRVIKEETGVNDIKEVLAKFQAQGDTHAHLVQLQTQNEVRIGDLKAKKLEVLDEFRELKFSGEAKHTHSIRLVEEFQQHLAESEAKMNETKQKYERVSKVLTSSTLGVKYLFDKLESIPLVYID